MARLLVTLARRCLRSQASAHAGEEHPEARPGAAAAPVIPWWQCLGAVRQAAPLAALALLLGASGCAEAQPGAAPAPVPAIRLAQAASIAPADAESVDVGYAGFAYAGDFQSIRSRFRFTAQLAPPHAAGDGSGPSAVEQQLVEGARALKPARFNLVVDSLGSLNSDRAIQVALVATRETVSTERIGELTKLFIDLHAEALFFDYKSLMILRTYPISVVYLSATSAEPTAAEELSKVRELLYGAGSASLAGRFLERVAKASLPGPAPRYIGVQEVTIAPRVSALLPPHLQGAGVFETWLADQFSEAFLEGTGVSVLPYAKGYAIGNTMAANMADGRVYNLKLPAPDYPVSINLQLLTRSTGGSSVAGTSIVYGALAHLLIEVPALNQCYLDAHLVNGETKLVPADESTVDDWPAYEVAIAGLFRKTSRVLGGARDPWIRHAFLGTGTGSACGAARDVMRQVKATREVINRCK